MIYTTLRTYTENFQTNLDTYLSEYEDNSKSEFLRMELKKYSGYVSSLIALSRAIKGYPTPKVAEIRSGPELFLRNNYLSVYNDIITVVNDKEKPNIISVDYVKLDNYKKSVSLIFDFIKEESGNRNNKQTSKKLEIEKNIWFKVGLLFANGTMEKYYSVTNNNLLKVKDKFTAPKIADELGDKGYNKYILATIQNYPKNNKNWDKNIFNSREKMEMIIEYCKGKNIPVIPYFSSRLPSE